jgi:hypothetical protein
MRLQLESWWQQKITGMAEGCICFCQESPHGGIVNGYQMPARLIRVFARVKTALVWKSAIPFFCLAGRAEAETRILILSCASIACFFYERWYVAVLHLY